MGLERARLTWGTGLVAVYAVAVSWPFIGTPRLPLLVSDALVSASVFATGGLVWREREHRATAVGLWLAAISWPLNWLEIWSAGALPLLAALEGPLASLFAVWALLRYPRPWLRRRHEAGIIVALVVCQAVCDLPVFTSTAAWQGYPGHPWLTVWADRRAYALTTDLYNIGGAVLALVLVSLIVVRLSRLPGPDRRVMRPLLAVLPISGVLVAIANLGNLSERDPWQTSLYALEGLGLILVPLAFLVAVVRRGWVREQVPALIRRLGPSPTPEQLQDAIADALSDPSFTLAYRADGSDASAGYVDGRGRARAVPRAGDGRRLAAVAAGRWDDAVLLIGDPLLTRHPQLLQDVAHLAAMMLENTRLQALERSRLEQVADSAGRLQGAVIREQHQVQSEVEQIVSGPLTAVRNHLARLRSATDVHGTLAAADQALSEACRHIQELAAGTPPDLLTEYGLTSTLTLLTQTGAAPPTLTGAVELAFPSERLPARVEAAAYFAVSELFANAVKHAGAERIRIIGRLDESAEGTNLVIDVTDNGAGGADPGGSGLTGISRRLSPLAGSLALSSRAPDGPEPHGTTATVIIPIN